ncbi:HNH endonuclease [Herbaspirillum sp. SJZ130]|nr:HNH endonuclease [Herbaspirillum sp. SJZ130]TQK03033.1 HNH endonuclease [Herbaspirillum sp. SJZ130]TQK06579.1 HNH endonuclease [Herbaspirillum sp. SJZ106]
MRQCIYCYGLINEKQISLEHTIPQFLGGAYAPDRFKTYNVCRQCNNNLGLFVDASFEKDWRVSQSLSLCAHKTYSPEDDVGLPLLCMGVVKDLAVPEIQAEEVCESWLGPSGEQIYWIRPKDENLYWYSGGNPITTKSVKTRAYFMFSQRTTTNTRKTLLAFRDSFASRKRVKKICCSIVEGFDMSQIGFAKPDDIDARRAEFFLRERLQGDPLPIQFSSNINFDTRFLAKLAIGIASSLFGEKTLQTTYRKELQKALHLRPDDPMPAINGIPDLQRMKDPIFEQIMGSEGFVTICMTALKEGISINLNINANMNWVIKCADYADLSEEDIQRLGFGLVLVLSKQKKKCVELPLIDYIAHKIGSVRHPALHALEISASTNTAGG